MEPSNFHRFYCSFTRTRNGDMLSCTGPMRTMVESHWAVISASMVSQPSQEPSIFPISTQAKSDINQGELTVRKSCIEITAASTIGLDVYEIQHKVNEDVYIGVIFEHKPSSGTDLDDVFAALLLENMKPFISAPVDQIYLGNDDPRVIATAIVDLFDERLRYISADDKWVNGGRTYFLERVYEFVRRGQRLEFCLPAFPCKSSSVDKVFGVMPDRGEQAAVEYLHSFIEEIEKIYGLGAKLWIISDGHVFSDCIGVDDETADAYNTQLARLNDIVTRRRGGRDRIGFKSLINLFSLDHYVDEISNLLKLPALPHQISTKRTKVADFSRQLLLEVCQTDATVLRSRIEQGSASVLKLYRGFSRFMLEDLDLNQYTKQLSRSQRKKLASKVAFEMIQRNEAYSNLVELLFPHHVRLSIHAHNNAGPKFGIRMFGTNVRAVEKLAFDGAEMRSVDLLHVPTPWHNCLVEIAGCETLFMVKAKTVRDALSSGKFSGGWVDGSLDGVAGHFRLQSANSSKTFDHKPGKAIRITETPLGLDTQSVCYLDNEAHYYMTSTTDVELITSRAYFGVV
ncbi:hypothetical protein JX265_010617 [Neoarthrinium moseri]|uniref:Pyoverdine/dityrosine biosynthesis protein n=1 Tax=Neoarthrinium moseri TaxID=1658444 RepID=A0A9P9WDW7_9PEZI|nr:hypothetical protein JX265_010617 [Neoarthrinium moseri]